MRLHYIFSVFTFLLLIALFGSLIGVFSWVFVFKVFVFVLVTLFIVLGIVLVVRSGGGVVQFSLLDTIKDDAGNKVEETSLPNREVLPREEARDWLDDFLVEQQEKNTK